MKCAIMRDDGTVLDIDDATWDDSSTPTPWEMVFARLDAIEKRLDRLEYKIDRKPITPKEFVEAI